MDYLNPSTDYDEANYQVLEGSHSRAADLYLSHFGLRRCEPDSSYGNKPYSDFVIHFILKGKGYCRLGTSDFCLQKGQAFFIPPQDADYIFTADHDDPWTYAWIGFNGIQALSYLNHTGLSAAVPVRNIAHMDDVCDVMTELLNIKALTLSNDIRRTGYLYKLLSILIAAFQSSQLGSTAYEYPAQTYAIFAKSYIDDNYGKTNITNLADKIGIDRSYLHNVFKKSFRLSPQEYLMQRRMEHAAAQLSSTTYPIKQIAKEIGYEDSLQFSKIFKKYYGQSPRAYRTAAGQKET